MSKYDLLGNRMKGYESATKRLLIRRMPVIIRLDGRAFHTFTRPLKEPFNEQMHELMVQSMFGLMTNMQNAVLGYTQSDEMSILLHDWSTHETQQWFDGKQSKIESVAASILTAEFNHIRNTNKWLPEISIPYATFDARVFNVPKEDVCNYFLWRQLDASRNSVQMLGRSYFSHKELHQKNNSNIQDMLMETHGVNWNDLAPWKRRGSCIRRGVTGLDAMSNPYMGYIIDENIPIFSQDRQYIEEQLN